MKPQRFFGLHMVEGLAEYREPGKNPFRVFIGEQTIKNMDSTFQGLPVYVRHIEENVDFNKDLMKGDDEQRPADGVVVKSFFNKSDGKHWVEFVVTSPRGIEAVVQKKWKLSNAYKPQSFKNGGTWHGVDYDQEVAGGEYEHLAIVPNPRYEESVILTPDEFKAYNEKKEAELLRIANSKETKKGESKMLKFFKREKVENSADFETMMVELPISRKEMILSDVIKTADKFVNMAGYASDEHMVKVGNEEMSVKDLVNKHVGMCNEIEEEKKKKEEAEKKENEKADKEKEEKDEPKKENSKEDHFEKLKNADQTKSQEVAKVILSDDKVTLGRSKYGSGR